jgi:hypothetical protein
MNVKLTKTSPLTGKDNTMELPLTMDEFRAQKRAWKAGALAQNAFPTLNADEREFIMTGSTPQCWDIMFPPEEGE